MKHNAFTMLELVFVIVVAGIIMALAMPSSNDNNLRQAADQVVRHIQYTQHLAMMDDKFDDGDSDWYLGRWQIVFANNNGSDGQWAYTIFSDWKGLHDGNPNKATATTASEYAYNPSDTTKYLTGGTGGTNIIHYDDKEASKDLNLGHKYGIAIIGITGGNTGSGANRILFDELGRPYRGTTNSGLVSSINSNVDRLATTRITITLTDASGNNVQIGVEPETGYTHIL
jgi:prepilin-type N-terminal cleavage/methylation domain-containing protein